MHDVLDGVDTHEMFMQVHEKQKHDIFLLQILPQQICHYMPMENLKKNYFKIHPLSGILILRYSFQRKC